MYDENICVQVGQDLRAYQKSLPSSGRLAVSCSAAVIADTESESFGGKAKSYGRNGILQARFVIVFSVRPVHVTVIPEGGALAGEAGRSAGAFR